VRKVRKFILFNLNLREGKNGNVEQHRKYQPWNWDGNKTFVQYTYLYFLASRDQMQTQ
jgi:hypothetical protein